MQKGGQRKNNPRGTRQRTCGEKKSQRTDGAEIKLSSEREGGNKKKENALSGKKESPATAGQRKKMGVIAKQSIKGALANYIGVAIGFATTFFVLTRYLSPEEVGLTRVMVDAAVLFSAVAQLGTGASIVRFFPHFKEKTAFGGFFGLALLVPLAGLGIVALAALLLGESIVNMYTAHAPLLAGYMYMLPMLIVFTLYLTVFETCSSVLLQITVPKMVREVVIRVFNLAAYLLYGFRAIDIDLFVWLFCGSYGAAMLLDLFYLLHVSGYNARQLFRVDWVGLKKSGLVPDMLRYTFYMTVTVLAANVPLLSSLFLGAKAGLTATGVYTIAFYIANVVEVPYRSLGAISRPVIAAAVKENNMAEVNRLGQQVSLHQMMVSLSIFYIIWINLDTLFCIIPNGADYVGGVRVVLILSLSKVLNSSLSIGTDMLNYSRHYAWALPLIGILTASALLLNGYLIGPWGINGAAAATLFSYAIYFSLLLLLLWRKMRVSLFSAGQAKTAAVMLTAFALNALWEHTLGPLTAAWSLWGQLAEAVAKSLLLGGAVAVAMLRWNISPTLNQMVRSAANRIAKRKG